MKLLLISHGAVCLYCKEPTVFRSMVSWRGAAADGWQQLRMAKSCSCPRRGYAGVGRT